MQIFVKVSIVEFTRCPLRPSSLCLVAAAMTLPLDGVGTHSSCAWKDSSDQFLLIEYLY